MSPLVPAFRQTKAASFCSRTFLVYLFIS